MNARQRITRSTAILAASTFLFGSEAAAQEQTLVLGELSTGATVSFTRAPSGEWGVDVSAAGTPRVSQARPARVEVYPNDAAGAADIGAVQRLARGYESVTPMDGGALAHATLRYGPGVVFDIEDRWDASGAVLSVRRTLRVEGSAPGGFYSAVMLGTPPDVTWPDIDYLAPTVLYGDTARHSDRTPGGSFNYIHRDYGVREDWMSAPVFALSFRDGASVAVLDPSPRGNTTAAEAKSPPGTVMIDERFRFGALGAREAEDDGVEFGFWLPGTAPDYGGPGSGNEGAQAVPDPAWRLRLHPIREGLDQEYRVAFRFGRGEGRFSGVTRNVWRWAWETLDPTVTPIDVELLRTTLVDHLADHVMVLPDGRAGIPYLRDSRTGEFQDRADATRAAMGFCARNIQAADLFLREAERDPGPRGDRLRRLGLTIIDSFVSTIPMAPPAGDGFDLITGEIAPAVWSVGQQFIRTPSEALYLLLDTYRRELEQGHEHPEWLRWAKDFSDWLLEQQRPDGSFPRSWVPGTDEVVLDDGTASYVVPPLLLAMHRETGEERYFEAAVRAGEYIWSTDGVRGRFHGGSIDASSRNVVVDSNAGQMTLEAFLELYDATGKPKWLERAKIAADFAETWTWIWNVPMPDDADDEALHWKKGVPTIGLSGITVRATGHVHVHLSYAAPLYAKLARYTGDSHYLDVARVLFHAIDPMVALPGRTYFMLGPGWVQENWRMGPGNPGRGYGSPGKWLPWLATIRLHAIHGLEREEPELVESAGGT